MSNLSVILISISPPESCLSTWIHDNEHDNEHVFIFGNVNESCDYSRFVNHKKYMGGSSREWLALGYMTKNHKSQFYLIGNTENYFNYDRLITHTNRYDGYQLPLIFTAEKNGPFIISHKAYELIYLYTNDTKNLYNTARHLDIHIIILDKFYACDWTGMIDSHICCKGNVNTSKFLGFSHMDFVTMINFHRMLTTNKLDMYLPLQEKYNIAAYNWSDIYEHVPTLYNYAKTCDSVIECGVRSGVSTWALLKGLVDNPSLVHKHLIGIDLDVCPNTKEVAKLSNNNDTDYTFIRGDCAIVSLPIDNADLVFIDTWHVYGQMKRELARFSKVANKYIILHDTTVDADWGETVRLGWDAEKQSRETGIPVDEIKRGIWPAVEEFLNENDQFHLLKRYTNCNGLTILAKKIT